ncbi:MAG: hypothetical protein OXB88_02990 [Bacteriovoracales bacterium]|nr:hypothetical protein [Bacteriovoracales bacterium]
MGIGRLENILKEFEDNLKSFEKSDDQFSQTYDLAIRLIKEYLKESSGSPTEINYLEFEQLIRKAFAISILTEELAVWKKFRKCRDDMARRGFSPDVELRNGFLHELRYLSSQITERKKYLE